ncbi:MAG: metallophosphoesterase [Clostridia bacterium]|nr:metallophosphoesterase [Clostridia bacterium]
MAVYAIADLHLSLGTDKPMDVVHGWEDYLERLESVWRKLIEPTDTVVIPGDISWAMSLEGAETDFAFLNSLPGRKLLLKGNHDYWWCTRRKMENFFAEKGFDTLQLVHNDAVAVSDEYAVCGTRGWFFDAEEDADKKVLLREIGRLHASLDAAEKLGRKPLVFLHYPPVCNGQECPEMMQALRDRGITTCYYGHVHGPGIRTAVNGEYSGIHFRLISADALRFCPFKVL